MADDCSSALSFTRLIDAIEILLALLSPLGRFLGFGRRGQFTFFPRGSSGSSELSQAEK
jgi:hypothetical protein